MLPFYIISTVVLLIFCIVFTGGYFELRYVKDNVDFTQSVEATITEVHGRTVNHFTEYYLFYEYTAQDGTYYCGSADSFDEWDEAVSHIGEKVQIYIDGKGYSVPSLAYRNKPNMWVLIIGILFLTAGLADLILLAIPHKWKCE